MRLWLSLVGMPSQLAPVEYTTMEKSAAHSATSASSEFPPKSTISLMVKTTELLMFVIMKTPRKLKRALIRIAGRTPMQRVLMHVAIALGASVQPLTKITPIVSSVVMSMAGLEPSCPMK